MFGWGARRAYERRCHYYEQVTEFLAKEFEWDQHTSDLLFRTLSNWDDKRTSHFEFILDDPMAAAFRLKWERSEGLRVAYYPTIPPGNPEREARAQRLTQQLRSL